MSISLYRMSGSHNVCVFIMLIVPYASSYNVITGDTEFAQIVNKPSYVDKSLLLKSVLEYNKLVITAPEKYLKTSNLKMIKAFLSINANESGHPQESGTAENLRHFSKLSIYTQERQFFDEHFGKYPVLYLDLETDRTVNNYASAVNSLRRSLHYAYLQHDYLRYSNKLDDEQKEICERWMGDKSYRSQSADFVKTGLEDLLNFLFKHFNRKAYVLVDSFDSLINKAMFDALSDDDFSFVIRLIENQMSSIFKLNPYVQGGVVTGLSNIATACFLHIDDIFLFRFLHNHSLVKYYGFLEDEVKPLICKPIFRSNRNLFCFSTFQEIMSHQYKSLTGEVIYSPAMILRILQFDNDRNHFEIGYINGLEKLFKHKPIAEGIQLLLQNQVFKIIERIYFKLDDLMDLRNAFLVSNLTIDYEIVFHHLFELGYLSYASNIMNNEVEIRIPNIEVGMFFLQEFKDFCIREHKVNRTSLNELNYDYTRSINEWFREYNELLQSGYSITEAIFKLHENKNQHHVNSVIVNTQ